MKIIFPLLPIITGLAVCIGYYYLDKSRFAVRGVVAPYFTAIALLFSFFAANLTVEVWQKVNRINSLLLMEASAARGMLRITEPFDPGGKLTLNAVDKLLNEVIAQEEHGARSNKLGEEVPLMFPELYLIGADLKNFEGNVAANAAFYGAVEQFRKSWFEWAELRKGNVVPAKYLIIFAFGLLTQISIGFSQAGNQRALSVAVLLFSLSFSCAVAIIDTLDDTNHPSIASTRAAFVDVLKNPLGQTPKN